MRRSLKILLSVLILMSFIATSLGFSSIAVKSIKLNATSVNLTVGKTYSLKATFTPANATNKKVTFSSANNSIATVSSSGNIKGIKAGKTVITVTSVSNKKAIARCNVTVTQAVKLNPVDLVWYTIGTPQKDQDRIDKAMSKITKEKINATIRINTVDWGAYNDKMKMLAAAGEVFDLCFTSNWANDFVAAVTKGALLPIDELLKNYGKNITSQVPGKFWNAVQIKGKKYAMFNYQISIGQNGLFVKKDLAVKYGLKPENIKKLSDMESFFESVKKNEEGITPLLTGGGLLPLFNREKGMSLDQATTSWSLPLYVRTDDPKLKVINIGDTEEQKERNRLMRSWYSKGYLRKDAASIKDVAAEAKTGKYAAFVAGTIAPGAAESAKAVNGFDVVVVPLTNPYSSTMYVTAAMTGISKTSKNPARAMMLFDLMYADKNLYNLICNGIEGKDYKKIDAKFIEPIADSGYAPNTDWVFGGQFNAYLKKGMMPDLWEQHKHLNETAEVSPLMGFIYDREAMKNECAQMEAVTAEYDKAIATGTVDPEKYEAEIKDKLLKAGMEKVIADVQKQLNAWRAANGK